MRIQYASDLHLEFADNRIFLEDNPLDVWGDILILAGDIVVFNDGTWEQNPFFDWCSSNFKETFIVPGNHEYYGSKEMTERFDNFEYLVRPNVHYINNRSKVFGDTEIFFTSLWTRVPESERYSVQMSLTDCYRIRYKGRSFNASDYDDVHAICLDWLTNALKASAAKTKVVVTHHCPTTRFIDPRFKDSTINSAFCVDLEKFIEESDIRWWIYGHTHNNAGSKEAIGNTTMLCNQLGYVRHNENTHFIHGCALDVD